MGEIAYRQVHLDFHTSGRIDGIAEKFDPTIFAKTLKAAHVDSITCFSRCHHGYLYYDSKRFPQRIHPHLVEKDLLLKQMEACHKEGIRVPIYLPVEWDAYSGEENPEWLIRDELGAPLQKVMQAGFYNALCVNTPYLDFLKEQVKEVIEVFHPIDGIFLDILNIKDCCCKWCMKEMIEHGINVEDRDERLRYAQFKLDRFKVEMTNFIHSFDVNYPVFYNVDHIGVRHRKVVEAFSHFEIESLPSGKWGYMHFPITQRYARTLGLPSLGMTGKFHTAWGDFHSQKNRAALEFECFHVLALNAGCSIGDQLHPDGELNQAAYDLIGEVYEQVEEKEAWCKNASAVCEIAVMASEEFESFDKTLMSKELCGTVRMLQEASFQFDVIDSEAELEMYRMILLPDHIPLTNSLEIKLKKYIKQGGYVIASYHSAFTSEQRFLDELGVTYLQEAPYSPDFMLADGFLGEGLSKQEYVMYLQGTQIKVHHGEEMGHVTTPYFNRTWKHYCSHMHTPSTHKIGYPGVVVTKQTAYFAHPIFTTYEEFAPAWCKQMMVNTILYFLKNKIVSHTGPSTMITTLNEQKENNRKILHALHYIPQRKGVNLDIIEDIIPLYNITFTIICEQQVKSVKLVPKKQAMKFEQKKDQLIFTVEQIYGHQMIEILY